MMILFKYLLFGWGRPCSHYIPRHRKKKLRRMEDRYQMDDLDRMTVRDENGNWQLKGVRWHELYKGAVITEELYQHLYGALWRLMEYEDSGLSPEEVWQLVEEREEGVGNG